MDVLRLFSLVALLLVSANCATLYAYYSTPSVSQLISIDPQTGVSAKVCDLSKFPGLLGAPGSTYPAASTLLFYTISASGNISVVEIEPSSCKTTSITVHGLAPGQNDVRDIKFDRANNMLYMVFPNPNCLHGSLNQVDLKTGAVLSHLANVIDPEGLGQTTGLYSKQVGKSDLSTYYYTAIPFGIADTTYQLNVVNLTTGDTAAINMNNNALAIGDTWDTNFTLSAMDTKHGPVVIGATSPPSTAATKQCYPSGFFEINTTTGDSSCVFGPIAYNVYPLSEYNPTTSQYYQVFNDNNNFFLATYNPQSRALLSTVPCKMCQYVTVLASL